MTQQESTPEEEAQHGGFKRYTDDENPMMGYITSPDGLVTVTDADAMAGITHLVNNPPEGETVLACDVARDLGEWMMTEHWHADDSRRKVLLHSKYFHRLMHALVDTWVKIIGATEVPPTFGAN